MQRNYTPDFSLMSVFMVLPHVALLGALSILFLVFWLGGSVSGFGGSVCHL